MPGESMLEVIHREAADCFGGWVFECPVIADMHGGGRTFSDSVAAAEHAARQQLSRQAGRSVGLEEAARHLHHTRAGGHLPRFAAF
jgi:hypothetical protein